MSQEPPQSTPSSASAKSADAAPQRSKLQVLLRMLRQIWEIVLALVPVVLTVLRQLGQVALTSLQWLQRRWAALLPRIRTLLPAWNTKLPDAVFTAVAVALLLLLFWLPVRLLFHPAATASLDQPTQSTPAPNPAPDLEKIAAIQAQMAEATAESTESLIQAVQVNFLRSRLTASVSPDWYTLPDAEREQLANELLKRSKKLDFHTLEIVDLEGTLLARSPVVGKKMVILVASRDQA